QSA
ncbi:hypothetical protein EC960939_5522, partial [Escherichia coli 96.0939]